MKRIHTVALCAALALSSCGGSPDETERPVEEPVAVEPAEVEALPDEEPEVVEAPEPEPEPVVETAPEPERPVESAQHQGDTGMITTDSGLKYEVITEGDGAKPTLQDSVTVHYKGELTDGTVFDSSYDRGTPATFPLARVVPGWREGVQLMPVGSTFRFEIPPDLGYGARGAGPIPPNSTLIFQVELLSIN